MCKGAVLISPDLDSLNSRAEIFAVKISQKRVSCLNQRFSFFWFDSYFSIQVSSIICGVWLSIAL